MKEGFQINFFGVDRVFCFCVVYGMEFLVLLGDKVNTSITPS